MFSTGWSITSARNSRSAAACTDFSVATRGLANALDGQQILNRGGDHPGEAAEPRQQRAGERLGVAPRQGEQHEFQHLVVGQRLWSRRQQALAQPQAVAFHADSAHLRLGRWGLEQVGRFGEAGRAASGCHRKSVAQAA